MNERFGPIYAAEDYAGFWRRTAALAIDTVILAAFYYSTPTILVSVAPDDWLTHVFVARVILRTYLLCIAYLVGMRLTLGGTLGYRCMRIKYAYSLGGRPPTFMVLYRAVLAVFFMTFALLLDHIWILFDRRKQAWHDKVSGFYVIKCSAVPRGEQRMVRRIINFMMFSFVVWEPAETP